MAQNFFSIVIPVHNEEKYLSFTLDAIKNIQYPKGFFEAIIVENGSEDGTYALAKNYVDQNIKLVVSEKGVSKAKNAGIKIASEKSDWIIFLDADTIISKNFLSELDIFLDEHGSENLSIGTTTVLPLGAKRLYADLWFAFYNIGHALTKTSFAIQIMNARYRSQVAFDEGRTFAEDLNLIKELRKVGNFFYFRTKSVHTSTRRFDEVGWFKLFIKWNWQALVLSKRKVETEAYKVIR